MSFSMLGLKAYAPRTGDGKFPRAAVTCSAHPLGVPLQEFLLDTIEPLPISWPQQAAHIASERLPSGRYNWYLVLWFGYQTDWQRDLAPLHLSGLFAVVPGEVDVTRLTDCSTVLLVHRHALDGQPGIVAQLPIESIRELPR